MIGSQIVIFAMDRTLFKVLCGLITVGWSVAAWLDRRDSQVREKERQDRHNEYMRELEAARQRREAFEAERNARPDVTLAETLEALDDLKAMLRGEER